MKKMLLVAVLMLFAVSVNADRIVRVHSQDRGTAAQLIQEGYDVTSNDMHAGIVDVMVPERFADELLARFPGSELVPRECSELLEENRGAAGEYYSPDESHAFWCNLAASYPDLVDTPVSIGQSFQGDEIWMINMTSPAGGSDYKPPLIFNSLIHAREPGGLSVLIDYAMWLTSNYDGGDTRAAWILDNTDLYFLPICNPDGYTYNLPGGMHRKNMNFTTPVPSDGVDLNRNFPYMWGYDDEGSSPNPYSETYRGSAAGSEDETQVVMNFYMSIQPIAAMNYHTYGGYLLFPWSYNNGSTPDESLFNSWGAAMTSYNGYDYGHCEQVLGYPSNGDQADWMYGGNSMQGILGFTPEVGDSYFWGSQNDSTAIAAFCEDCRYMNIWLCMTAPGEVGIEESSVTPVESLIALGPVSPNPVLLGASFSVTVPNARGVDIGVFDLTGRRVSEIPAGGLQAGENVISWSVPADLPSGVYTLRAVSGAGEVAAERFTVLR